MNKTLNVLFFLRTRTSCVNGPASIYMRVTVEGDRFEMATCYEEETEEEKEEGVEVVTCVSRKLATSRRVGF